MTAHTPGPWRHDRDASDGGAPIIAAERRLVAKVLYHNGSDDPEVDANARLIESAPDLLAALERLDRYYQTDTDDDLLDVYNQARAALAKARGEAP